MPFQAARIISLVPGGVIVQRRAVKLDAQGRAVAVAAITDNPVGIALESAAAANGPAITIALLDGAKVEIESGLAGTITPGDLVNILADGRATNAAVATSRNLGIALTSATAAGQYLTIVAAPIGRVN